MLIGPCSIERRQRDEVRRVGQADSSTRTQDTLMEPPNQDFEATQKHIRKKNPRLALPAVSFPHWHPPPWPRPPPSSRWPPPSRGTPHLLFSPSHCPRPPPRHLRLAPLAASSSPSPSPAGSGGGGVFLSPSALAQLDELAAFRYEHAFPHGHLTVRALGRGPNDDAVAEALVRLLTTSFSETVRWAPAQRYAQLLTFVIRRYLYERRGLAPHAAVLVGFYRPADGDGAATEEGVGEDEDGEDEGEMACTAEVSFDEMGAPGAPPTPTPPLEFPYMCNMTVKTSLRRAPGSRSACGGSRGAWQGKHEVGGKAVAVEVEMVAVEQIADLLKVEGVGKKGMGVGVAERVLKIRVFDLPLRMMNAKNGALIGNKVGTSLLVDTEADGSAIGGYLQVKVKVDVRKPLMRGIVLEGNGGGWEGQSRYTGRKLIGTEPVYVKTTSQSKLNSENQELCDDATNLVQPTKSKVQELNSPPRRLTFDTTGDKVSTENVQEKATEEMEASQKDKDMEVDGEKVSGQEGDAPVTPAGVLHDELLPAGPPEQILQQKDEKGMSGAGRVKRGGIFKRKKRTNFGEVEALCGEGSKKRQLISEELEIDAPPKRTKGLEKAAYWNMPHIILETDAANLGVAASLAGHGVSALPTGEPMYWCEAPSFVVDLVSDDLPEVCS
ncbi:hypothetical protein PR202_gb14917 [Eleusine coracana subsp. coracana]|uniref:Uncharacterized protein n=1 Tax=Eleusine coracana subsp. coracana TaxID=191504 RepID=A0AAV5EWW8_ELECO|nr:hypothetical protein PR202_gb14917 [Eleusine coracana subsp. coracana]